MKLNILGKQRKGKKSFELIANDYECFRIEALIINSIETRIFENVTNILWRFSGESVELTFYNGTKLDFNFIDKFDKVKILNGKVNSETQDDVLIVLNSKEYSDIRHAIVIAMKTLDAGNNSEKILSDRLEIIDKKHF